MRTAIAGRTGDFRQGDSAPWEDEDSDSVRADIVLTNPPFNNRTERRSDYRPEDWDFGVPPSHNDNFAWLQHAVASLAPDGVAVVLMPEQAAVSADRSEMEIRRRMVAAGAVRAVVTLPARIFPNTDIAASVWIVARGVSDFEAVFLVDAGNMGVRDGNRIRLPDEAVAAITDCFRNRRSLPPEHVVELAGGGSAINADLDTIGEAGFGLRPADYIRRAAQNGTDALLDDIDRAIAEFGRSRESTAPRAVLDRLCSDDGPLRDDPEARRVVRLDAICDIQPGLSHDLMPNGEVAEERSVPVVKRKHLRDFRVDATSAEAISERAADRLGKYLLEPNDILLARSGSMIPRPLSTPISLGCCWVITWFEFESRAMPRWIRSTCSPTCRVRGFWPT